jgi:pimeloyl-ACP methyl ester carboxylesterase
VLLWLHGGPGAAQMPVANAFNGALEQEFVVVHWDQRGAGKSNPPDFDESSMTFQQYLDDAHTLTGYLQQRFGQQKIYLLGHSWGSQIGLRLVQVYPEDYHAYIGVSQVVEAGLAQQVGYDWLREQIQARGDEKALRQLEALGKPPYRDHATFVSYVQLVDAYGGDFDVSMLKLFWAAVRAPEYNLADMQAWLRGANRGSGPMWHDPAC